MLLTHVQTCDDTLLSKCYGMDCFGTNLTHVQTCDDIRARSALHAIDSFGTYLTHAPTCDDVRVKVRIRNGLHRYILHTCPKL